MRFPIGLKSFERSKQQKDVPVVWDAARAINPHWLIVGASGTGKTHTLRRLIGRFADLAQNGLRVHVFDVHGDITMDASGQTDMPSASVVQFSESTPYGLNPLDVDPDPHFGGIRRRVQGLIAGINHTSRALGHKQQAVLRAILMDLYAANGYQDGNPSTWRTAGQQHNGLAKRCPTLLDALRFAKAKHRALYLGTSERAVSALEAVNKRAGAVYAKARALVKAGDDPGLAAIADEELEKAIGNSLLAFEEALRAIRSGRELEDLLRYDSKEVLKSVVDHLENLAATGVFRPAIPPFAASMPIWGYDLRALPEDDKKLFVRFRLEQILQRARMRGVQTQVREVVVVDEAHLFFDESADNPLNLIALEARKFGLALICASQSPTHFSEDFLGNCGTKLLLGLDTMYWDGACRKLKIEPDKLRWLRPQKTAALSVRSKGELSSVFVNVDLDPTAVSIAEARS